MTADIDRPLERQSTGSWNKLELNEFSFSFPTEFSMAELRVSIADCERLSEHNSQYTKMCHPNAR